MTNRSSPGSSTSSTYTVVFVKCDSSQFLVFTRTLLCVVVVCRVLLIFFIKYLKQQLLLLLLRLYTHCSCIHTEAMEVWNERLFATLYFTPSPNPGSLLQEVGGCDFNSAAVSRSQNPLLKHHLSQHLLNLNYVLFAFL